MSLETGTLKLNRGNVAKLGSDVEVPRYDRSLLVPHTLHLGVGGFHRAHQAVYLDDLLSMAGTPRWGETGIGVLQSDDRMRDAMLSQDCLYTLVERSAEQQVARVIGSMTKFLYAPKQREEVIEALASPLTRIVTLTITEGGYFLHEGTGQFDPGHPLLQYDLAHPEAPSTSFGLIAEALDRRRRRNLPGFTLQSCDNLQGNGHITHDVLLGFAALRDTALHDYIAGKVSFPSSMVDRITPSTTAADIEFVAERFKVEDAWPVVTEPFRQWVIEDTFVNGRPEFERVGAEIVSDVAPYELMKIRLLNGSHMAMAYLGALAGHTYVHEVMQDGVFRAFIDAFMEEVTPVVPVIPGTSTAEYKQSLVHRFLNPTINDQVTRICSEGSAKIPKWILPSITELADRQHSVDLLSLVLASWIFYLSRGVDEHGRALNIIDARAGELREIAKQGGLDPRPFLSIASIFGEEMVQNRQLVGKVETALRLLDREGSRESVKKVLAAGLTSTA